MKIAFVGITRKYKELPEDYRNVFDKHHLELPYYYARDGKNDVTIVTEDDTSDVLQLNGGSLRRITNEQYLKSTEKYDVVIHWRKWFQEFYRKDAVNLINCQDHSFSQEWTNKVRDAYNCKQLTGILCFPTWHEDYIQKHMAGNIRTISGLTLGVDTEIYHPEKKERKTLLWASDPGRGLVGTIELVIKLWQKDKEYKLVVLSPDYVKSPVRFSHPAIEVKNNVKNGPELWNLFNTAGIVPYTSEFMEPSSRVHRQGQAAGCMVLYPPNRGTPSDLIIDGVTGFVRPIDTWCDLITKSVDSGLDNLVGAAARKFAISENWGIQAERFNETIGALL